MRSEKENDVLQAVRTGRLAVYLLAPPIYNAWGWNKWGWDGPVPIVGPLTAIEKIFTDKQAISEEFPEFSELEIDKELWAALHKMLDGSVWHIYIASYYIIEGARNLPFKLEPDVISHLKQSMEANRVELESGKSPYGTLWSEMTRRVKRLTDAGEAKEFD